MSSQRIIVTQNSSISESTDFITNDPNTFDRLTSPEERLERIQALREKNQAVVGEFDGENGRKYEVKSNGNQTTTTITEVNTQVDVYEGITSAGTDGGAFANNTSSNELTNNDLAVAQGKLQEAVNSGNLSDPTYGTGIPSGADLPPGSFGISDKGKKQAAENRAAFKAANAEKQGNGGQALQIEFGKVDKIIRKLHLRNLIYPIDADFGNTQDYMQINQFTYRPPNQDVFFGTDPNFSGILKGGLTSRAPRLNEDFLGLVKLPMPNSLADSNNVSWGADQLNALTAAVSSAVFGQGNDSINNLLGEKGFGGKDFQEAKGFGKLKETLNILLNELGNITGTIGDEAKGVLSELKKNPSGDLAILGRTLAGSALLNIGQFGISPETILSRGQGAIPNNNMALLFNSPTLREFTFSWKMTPRSREEAQRVNNIIRFFKQGMAPKKGLDTKTGGGSYFLGTPNVFDIVFKTTKDGGNFFFSGDDENNSVLRIKTCACTGTAINYTPDGMWNAYDRGQPVSVTMSLRFAELEPIFDTDYDENVFNYSESRPDLRPVPIDAVGY